MRRVGIMGAVTVAPTGPDPEDERFMRRAIAEAEHARGHGDVPIGAVVVHGGEVVGAGHNERELRQDPTAHAEIIALRAAAHAFGTWRVLDSTLYVTLEPCAMCSGAVIHARIARLVFAADDPKTGAAGSVFDTLISPLHNHRIVVEKGLRSAESAELIRAFFRARR